MEQNTLSANFLPQELKFSAGGYYYFPGQSELLHKTFNGVDTVIQLPDPFN